jgi:Domain of unknown function (DU1801)
MAVSEEEKQNIFERLKKIAKKNCPPLVMKSSTDIGFEMIGNVPTIYGSKKEKVPGMYMASATFRKNSVVFYFFPCYMNDTFKPIAPNTFKHLEGKTCFHFKKIEDVDEQEIQLLFKKGIEFYKKQSWVK